MKVPYFKKKKMYAIAKELFSELQLPKLIECNYKFYRGSEWLRFSSDIVSDKNRYVNVEIYHTGYILNIEKEYRNCYENDEEERVYKRASTHYSLQSDNSLKKYMRQNIKIISILSYNLLY